MVIKESQPSKFSSIPGLKTHLNILTCWMNRRGVSSNKSLSTWKLNSKVKFCPDFYNSRRPISKKILMWKRNLLNSRLIRNQTSCWRMCLKRVSSFVPSTLIMTRKKLTKFYRSNLKNCSSRTLLISTLKLGLPTGTTKSATIWTLTMEFITNLSTKISLWSSGKTTARLASKSAKKTT